MKYLTVGELISILKFFDRDLPVVITREGNAHQYGVTDENICVLHSAYFGNDPDADKAIGNNDAFLNIGSI